MPHKPRWHGPHEPRGALTYSELLPEDSLLTESRAVPASEAELVLALVDAHLRPLPDHDDGIGPALADGTLPRGQARNLVADDVGSQGHDRRQRSAKRDETPRGELAGQGPLRPALRKRACSRRPPPGKRPALEGPLSTDPRL